MASVGQVSGMSMESFLGVGATLVIVTGTFVAIRLSSDMKFSGKLHTDDYLSVVAVVFLAACFGVFYELLKAATDTSLLTAINPMPLLYHLSQLQVAMVFLSGISIWTAKAPVLLLYIRLFGIRRWMRISCYTTLTVTGLVILVGDAYNAAMCMPRTMLDPLYIENCNTVSSTVGVVCGFVGIFADAAIFALPLPVIANLHIPLPRKIGLAIAFIFGMLAIVASSVSLNYKWQSLSGTATDIILAMTLTIIESTIIIAAGCAPSTNAFLAKWVSQSVLYKGTMAFMSSISLRSLLSAKGRTSRSSRRQKIEQDPSSSQSQGGFAYVEIDNAKGIMSETPRFDHHGNLVNIPLKTL